MKNTDEKNELLVALALGALDGNEARDFAAQVANDTTLTSELEAWREIAAEMAFVAPTAEPAPLLRENILSKVRQTPQNSNLEQKATDGAVTNVKSLHREQPKEPSRKSSSKDSIWNLPVRPKKTFWGFAPLAAATAASIIAVLLGVSLYNATRNNKLKNDQIAELNQQIIVAEQKVSETQIQLERERQERDLLASPASFIKALDGTKEIPTAKARLVIDPKTGKAVLSVEGLPAPPPGKAYQIWFISDPKHPAPGKTFETDQNGKAILRDQMSSTDVNAGVCAITLEPIGGSAAPTTSILLITDA